MRMRHSTYALLLLPLALAIGCSEPVQVGGAPRGAAPGRPAPGPTVAIPPLADAADAGVADAGVDAGPRQFTDEDFVEQDVIRRDPFRDFVLSIQAQNMAVSPRLVKMRNVSLDQMHLIAIISGIPVPYAMIQDPEGIGHVVVRGDYIGRDEVVNAGGADGMPIALNWRIDRIREGELILTREDPLHPDQPPLMRSMAIRDVTQEGEYATSGSQSQLSNTGETSGRGTGAVAPTPGVMAPIPGAAPAPAPAPAPMPQEQQRSYGMGGGSFGQTPPAPTPPSSGGTSGSGSTSRFGGVFNRR